MSDAGRHKAARSGAGNSAIRRAVSRALAKTRRRDGHARLALAPDPQGDPADSARIDELELKVAALSRALCAAYDCAGTPRPPDLPGKPSMRLVGEST